MSSQGSSADRVDVMAAELERLRALVGPLEESYEDLRVELAEARQAVRIAELDAGRLRGELTAMSVDLHRARQDQYHVRRLLLRPLRALRVLGRRRD